VLSRWTLRALALSGSLGFISDDDPERMAHALRSDWRVFAFSLAMGALGVACCGLLPALRATRPDLANAVKSDRRGPRGSRPAARTVLTIAQIALSVVLLVSAALLTRSFARALRFDLGFERAQVLRVGTALSMVGFDSVRLQNVSRDLERRIAALPGVNSVARGDVPIVGGRFRTTLTVTGSSTATHDGYIAAVTPSYFTALGIPIVRGRAFTNDELQSRAQVVVISEATARTLWPNDDPIGKTVGVDPKKKGTLAPETRMPAAIVVGIARDAQTVEIAEIPPVYVYAPSVRGDLLVRADGDVRALIAPIRGLWRTVAPSAPVSSVPLSELIAENGGVYNVRFAAGFAAVLGALALVLASVGVFGLMAYSVAQQTRELGIRMALGAGASDVMSLVLGQGGKVAGIGVAVGLVGGLGATRVISSLLFGMSPLDIPAYAGVVVLIATVAVIACYLPARRATRIDPLVALKTE
jgi:predicted permease